MKIAPAQYITQLENGKLPIPVIPDEYTNAYYKALNYQPKYPNKSGNHREELLNVIQDKKPVCLLKVEVIDPSFFDEYGLETIQVPTGLLIFKPENSDIANMLKWALTTNKLDYHNIDYHIIMGVGLGYTIQSVVNWVLDWYYEGV